MGGTRVAFVLLLLEECDLAGVGTLQLSLASRIFIMHPSRIPSPMVIQDDDH
jgi:hypothetical protein